VGGTAPGDAAPGGLRRRSRGQFGAGVLCSPDQAGVAVRQRHSTLNPHEITGYAVGLARHTGKDGGIIWYGGGKLAADLTLPKLRRRWDEPQTTATDQSGTSRLTAQERHATYAHAARHAAAAARRIRHCSMTDPAGGADAAWATADTLHMAARALRSPALRQAADAYDRACRTPYGRIPRRTREGDQLRHAARSLARAARLTDPVLASLELVAALAELVVAVAELRQAQRHARPGCRCPPGREPSARRPGQSSPRHTSSSPVGSAGAAAPTHRRQPGPQRLPRAFVPATTIWPYRPRAPGAIQRSAAPQLPPAQAGRSSPVTATRCSSGCAAVD
jgi:hypothetical protein